MLVKLGPHRNGTERNHTANAHVMFVGFVLVVGFGDFFKKVYEEDLCTFSE